MSRKNDRVRRANDRGRLQRRTRGERPVKNTNIQRIDVEEMIIPDGSCTFQGRPKARFATREKADAALKQAQRMRARAGSGHVEKRFYACPEGGCGGFHLTSREKFDENVRQFRHQQFLDQTKNTRLEEIRREQQQ